MELTERLDRAVEGSISSGKVVGAVTLVARDGEILYRRAHGHFDREAGTPMFPEGVFRLASLTKPIVAATALAMMDRGLIGLDNAVSDHLPWFRPKLPDGREPRITIRHLLTHTSGLGYDFNDDPEITGGMQATNLTLEENFTRYAERIPLSFEPGTRWQYGVNTDVLGAVIERIHATQLAQAVEHYVTGPLGMRDTGFSPPADASRLAVPYADDTPVPRRMSDPDTVPQPDRDLTFSPGRIFNPRAFHSGGGGAVGSADDMLAFFEAIRNRGTPILKHDTVALAIQNQIGDVPGLEAGMRFGFLGAVIVDPEGAGRPQPAGTIRWGGVYGHDWFVDFTSGITCVIMTNTAVEGNRGAHARNIRNAIYEA